MIELFKPIPNTNYSVSNTGVIRNDLTNNFPKLTLTNQGYLHVALNRKSHQVHVLTCTVWNGPKPFPKAVCRHLDDIKTNNLYTNLEWGTYKQNGMDALANGRFTNICALTLEQVEYAKRELSTGGYGTITRLIEELGVSRATLGRIRAGKAWNLPLAA